MDVLHISPPVFFATWYQQLQPPSASYMNASRPRRCLRDQIAVIRGGGRKKKSAQWETI